MYALKQYIFEIENVAENGDVFLKDQDGGRTFMTEEAFTENCIPVKKVESKQAKKRSSSEWADIESAYKQEWINNESDNTY
jgi:hypothetical protein